MIEQQVQLHSSFGAPKLRPVVQAGAEIDHRGIQAQQPILEAELVARRHRLTLLQQLRKDGPVQLPGTMLVGVSQGRFARRLPHSQMPQLAFATGQPAANLAQRLGSS